MRLLPLAPGGGYTLAPMAGCPDENVLVQLAHGGIESPALRATLQGHLDGCDACRTLVAAVAGGSAPISPHAAAPALAPGATLGRYRIERPIGAGGMGVLYEAHDTRLDRRVALKLMHPSHDDEVSKARLWREAQAMARLSHPNVVNVFDLGEYEGQLFLAMELVEGGTLRAWLRAPRSRAQVLAMLAAAGEGLAAAHRAGVVHRDFKPENVLVGPDGRPRVTDFGLARPGEPRQEPVAALATGPIDLTRTGTMMGTPAYMSPEQLLRQPADARSDQYSFCVTLFEALYGKRPHDGRTLDEVRARVLKGALARPGARELAVPDRVWQVVSRGLSVEPEHRFATMDALLARLRPKASPPWRWVAAALAAATLLVGLARAELLRPAAQPAASGVAAAGVTAAQAEAAAPKAPAPPAGTAPASQPGAPETPPVAEPAAAAPERTPLELALRTGSQRILHLPGLQRIAVRDPKIVDVRTLGDNQLLVLGKAAGKTSVLTWTADGKAQEYAVAVFDPQRAPAESAIELVQGAQKEIGISNLSRIAIGDPAIADARTAERGKLLLVGVGPGTTTLLAWKADGSRYSFRVTVRAP